MGDHEVSRACDLTHTSVRGSGTWLGAFLLFYFHLLRAAPSLTCSPSKARLHGTRFLWPLSSSGPRQRRGGGLSERERRGHRTRHHPTPAYRSPIFLSFLTRLNFPSQGEPRREKSGSDLGAAQWWALRAESRRRMSRPHPMQPRAPGHSHAQRFSGAQGGRACSGPLRKEGFSIASPSDRGALKSEHPPSCRCETGRARWVHTALAHQAPTKVHGLQSSLSHLHRSSTHIRRTSCARSSFGSPVSKPSLQTLQTGFLCAPGKPRNSGLQHSG